MFYLYMFLSFVCLGTSLAIFMLKPVGHRRRSRDIDISPFLYAASFVFFALGIANA